MFKSSTTLLIILLITIIVLIILVQIFAGSRQKDSVQNLPIEVPSATSTPENPLTPEGENVKILTTNITEAPLAINAPVKFKFSKTMDNESLKLQITPQEELLPLFDQTLTELSIEPTNAWDFNTKYQIKIFKETKAADGSALDKDYEFSFSTLPYSGI